jgi:PAS domain S-box-containing protein
MIARDSTGAEMWLLSLPPTRGQTQWAIAVAVCQVAALALLAPFAKIQLAEINAFIPAFEGVIFVTDLVTSVLLFSQFAIYRLRALLVLACGYLFSALIVIPHALTFPGAFSPTGLLGAGLQTTASLYWSWHLLFPFALLGYGLMRDEKSDPGSAQPSLFTVIVRSAGLVFAFVCGLTLLATVGNEYLPVLFADRVAFTPAARVAAATTMLASVSALAVLLLRRRSLLDQWLMIVALAAILEMGLGAMFVSERYSLGFYAGRLFSLLTSTIILVVLLAETTRLYAKVARSNEGKIRRLVDSNIIGIFIWDFDGRILEANEAFLNMLGYAHEDLVAGRVRWTDLTPPDWRDRDTRLIQEHKAAGTLQPFEKEYFRKNGTRVPVFMGVATFEEDGNQGVAFVLDLTERKHAEEALRRSEANLAEAQRLSHTGSWTLSPVTTKILYWSEECFRIWGFDPAQGLPDRETVWRRIHPNDRDRVLAEAQEALRRKRDYTIEFRIVLPDGTVKYLEAVGHHLFSEHGELVQVVGTNVDLTERKRAEEALRDSECKLRQIIEAVPSLIWSTDPAGEPTQLNQRIFDYSGMRFEDFKHGGWEAFIHPDDFPETIRAFSHAIQTGTSYETVHRLRRADGEFRWHHARGEPLRDEKGRIIQWYGLAVDINEAKKIEDRLRRSEAYLAEAQMLSHTGSWAHDPATSKVLYWSEECYRIWGFDPAHGLPDSQIAFRRIHSDDRDRVWDEAMEGRRQKRDYTTEFRIALPDGTVKYVEGIIHHVISEEGELIELVGTNVDVTERKRARDEHERLRQLESDLARVNRLSVMGELTASLAHEITQPISSARNNARAGLNFLDKGPPELSEVREALNCVVGDADRAGSIVDRIRDQVRKAPPRKLHFDLNESLEEVLTLARSAITKNGVSIQIRLADGLLPVYGDRVQLQQVLLNLILNAAEAMGSVQEGPRELSISTEQDQAKGVLVAIRDSGPGIDPANRERVFEAFYTTKSSGVGMGLSICRSIIDAHGGRLWADANDPKGAVFQFTLPSEF